jgi:hypothetical protein
MIVDCINNLWLCGVCLLTLEFENGGAASLSSNTLPNQFIKFPDNRQNTGNFLNLAGKITFSDAGTHQSQHLLAYYLKT